MTNSSNQIYADDDPASWNWVDPQVLKTESSIRRLSKTLTPANPLHPYIDPKILSFVPWAKFDRVCFSRTHDGKEDSFYVYTVLFTELRLRLPFSDFQVQILNKINAAPTQFHPNGWLFVTSFELLCQSHALSSRYFDFEDRFFRVEGTDEGSLPFFMEESRKSKFPLHWSKSVRFPDTPSYSSLSRRERALVDELQKLKAPSSCAALIRRYDKPLTKPLSVPRSGVSPHQSERHPNDESKREEEEAEVSSGSEEMRTERRRAFTLGEAEAEKKKKKKKKKNEEEKVSLENIVDLEMDKHLRGFERGGTHCLLVGSPLRLRRSREGAPLLLQ